MQVFTIGRPTQVPHHLKKLHRNTPDVSRRGELEENYQSHANPAWLGKNVFPPCFI